jgi:hypothetical protein
LEFEEIKKKKKKESENKMVFYYPDYLSTAKKSIRWRIWHNLIFLVGGITFLFGSLVYLPSLEPKINKDVMSGWLYTIGSTAFLLGDFTEWCHYRYGCVGSL